MIIQIGTEVDESRILWKHKESDEWERADIDDLIRTYEDSARTGEWIKLNEYKYECPFCHVNFGNFGLKMNYCLNCGAKMGGDSE